jgi:tetratricopeptide (TPR) repeat protein
VDKFVPAKVDFSLSKFQPNSRILQTQNIMSSKDSSNASVDTPSDDPSVMEVEDKSNEEMALKLKDQGNEQLMKGHFLEAIGFYSDALEYCPTNAIMLSNRAQAYIKVENYGLAMADATAALESDPKYAKAYYRRGSSQFALGHYKDARKDFRKVCSMKPKDRDARAKFNACDKVIKAEAFRKAIYSEMTAPLSETYDISKINLESGYDGPNPTPGGPTTDMNLEASMFEPGNLPSEFVMVRTR